jgi:hypothetical protein
MKTFKTFVLPPAFQNGSDGSSCIGTLNTGRITTVTRHGNKNIIDFFQLDL